MKRPRLAAFRAAACAGTPQRSAVLGSVRVEESTHDVGPGDDRLFARARAFNLQSASWLRSSPRVAWRVASASIPASASIREKPICSESAGRISARRHRSSARWKARLAGWLATESDQAVAAGACPWLRQPNRVGEVGPTALRLRAPERRRRRARSRPSATRVRGCCAAVSG